jgi:prepilin-type N-terminal cleavage/methylation domain-containing protein
MKLALSSSARGTARRGFTLLELLVAMAVSALLLALIAQAIGSLQQANRSARDAWGRDAAFLLDQRTLVALLRDALPPASGGQQWSFDGRSQRLEFSIVPPQALQRRGLLRAVVTLTRAEAQASEAVVEFRTLSGKAIEVLPRQSIRLGQGFAAFEYVDRVGGKSLAAWRDESRLPALIRLNLRDAQGGTRTVVAVAPRRQRAASCPIDPVSMQCRADG